jgi:hypothetical protein
MNPAKSIINFLCGVLLLSAAEPAPLRPDIEVDPTPYFEHGYSFFT